MTSYTSAQTQPWPGDHLHWAVRAKDERRVRELLAELMLEDSEGWLIAVSYCVERVKDDVDAVHLLSRHLCLKETP